MYSCLLFNIYIILTNAKSNDTWKYATYIQNLRWTYVNLILEQQSYGDFQNWRH